MSEHVHCNSCDKDFEYESEIITGGTKQVDNKSDDSDDLGDSKGIFGGKKKPKLQNTLLECPYCKKEDYYKVMVG
ncbi:MAG: hypothetical protein KDK36_02780 [Leptospiraceae bacterium]|nr:hypothetical protein [Leptospiraceae bacterium]